MEKNNPQQLIRFAIVGTAGFIIDATILTLLSLTFGINLYASRAVSFTSATLGTWLLNRAYTFKENTIDVDIHSSEYLRYLAVQTVGAAINLFIFSLCVHFYPYLKQHPVIPLAVGAIFGLLFNFFGCRMWVYPSKEKS